MAHVLPEVVSGVTVTPLTSARAEADRSGRLRIRQRALALNLAATEPMLHALLGALASANAQGDVLVVQVVLGRAVVSEAVPRTIEDPTLSVWDKLLWGSRPASSDLRSRLAGKLGQFRFRAAVRMGVSAAHSARRMLAV